MIVATFFPFQIHFSEFKVLMLSLTFILSRINEFFAVETSSGAFRLLSRMIDSEVDPSRKTNANALYIWCGFIVQIRWVRSVESFR